MGTFSKIYGNVAVAIQTSNFRTGFKRIRRPTMWYSWLFRGRNFSTFKYVMAVERISANDLDVVIEGWERKFEHLSQCIQLASEKANTTMSNIVRDSRAREGIQERCIEEMHEGLTQFLERCDPAHLTALRSVDAPAASTPFTPTGVPNRLRPDFDFESPVNQSTHTESTRNDIDPLNTDPRNINMCHRDRYDSRESTHNSIDPRNRDQHDARDRSRDHRSNERPTHEDDRGDNSPKVPTFDGTVSSQFRPWIIQFEAITRHQCWTLGERVVRLVASLTGPAANLLIGMTMGQLDDYTFLVARLSRRYDPPKREEAHCAELRAHTRRRNESADEFAENLKNLAQRAYTSADQNMLDNLVVERFREGHGNKELKKHLCLYPSTGLQDLIGACVRFETHVEIGSRAHKSNKGLYTVQGANQPELTLEEVTRAAR